MKTLRYEINDLEAQGDVHPEGNWCKWDEVELLVKERDRYKLALLSITEDMVHMSEAQHWAKKALHGHG